MKQALMGIQVIDSQEFLRTTLDTLTEHIVVIDTTGLICFVNRAWTTYGQQNNCLITTDWTDVNYLDVCDTAAANGDDFGLNASRGIRQLCNDRYGVFSLEYPCHSPTEARWFLMTATHMEYQGAPFYLITHTDMTRRKLAENALQALSRTDSLTGLANRRAFDEFLDSEWSRCTRHKQALTLVLIDIDHFKLVNDRYGHQAGDDCLVKIAAFMSAQKNRPGDMYARYGGEEFAYVFGNTTSENALVVIRQVLDGIRRLGIPNQDSPADSVVTASAGLATIYPDAAAEKKTLIESADQQLYLAKSSGRNQIAFQST
jgi:diguanylate cyclase (GGDEF)-like protein